jgi:polyhydroxybutyrate depolymerase
MVSAAIAVCLLAPQSQAAGLNVWTFQVSGAERIASVHVPRLAEGSMKGAAVIMLHGGMGSADQIERVTGFHRHGASKGFVTAYPEGTEFSMGSHAWNSGYLMRDQVGKADDVGFLAQLVERLVREAGVDRSRIFMVGASNGAMMTYRFAQERADLLAGAATVVGAMFEYQPAPSRPVPLLAIVAENDESVPKEGGWSKTRVVRRNQAAPYKPYDESLSQWARWNGSGSRPTTSRDGIGVVTEYQAGPGPITKGIVGLGAEHGWIGSPGRRGQTVVPFDTTRTVLEFFEKLAGGP